MGDTRSEFHSREYYVDQDRFYLLGVLNMTLRASSGSKHGREGSPYRSNVPFIWTVCVRVTGTPLLASAVTVPDPAADEYIPVPPVTR